MECPFCFFQMKTLDNAHSSFHYDMVWICKSCPNEVRILSTKNEEAGTYWKISQMSIFVPDDFYEYCLHWKYIENIFEIIRIGYSSNLLEITTLPHDITPINAKEKLKVLLTFV